ncbi:mycothiol system anti-sigma-R factor [Corynebacterium uberis]|uniref:mycothiol system anti-sigma-R factor n=1 Tax=Corynebacterium TaxID=1716 RepID=UPI001D0B3D72|nr:MULTISPECIES: mycothiol system anti-sigma-R factor [Corynebacterium]MCZ9309217.1 mycothiol system anti-sigma-R factor [Corynebacterium sp. c6VSa_13]UDL72776.1 mycothiol system anti-sigma-R factor [Corynebacterium uberis]UDL76347.1 mycothiol system anti-sigma-R factor [Corynebacterium uberis]UDL78559.1 mycothiol system anti-sigma-R factor [Corynebacterium uberis]UDL80840.1 mycothiol system anti-sigma-R factor [Corynebacterium uberis]
MTLDKEPCGCNCQDAEQALFELLDAHLTHRECEQLRAHIQACPECYSRLQLEEAVRALLSRCCAPPPAPVQLRTRITAQIRIISS